MSDRFKKLFEQPHNLYTKSAPIIIVAGVLLEDTETGNILAQIKYQNIDNRPIKAMRVSFTLFDITGKKLEDSVKFEYLDLNEKRPHMFGAQRAVVFSNIATRSFSIEIEEVIFDNNSSWSGVRKIWDTLPEQITLQKALNNPSLQAQYFYDVGGNAKYVPEQISDLWYCTCGSINHSDETSCIACNRKFTFLQNAFNIDSLKIHHAEKIKKIEAAKSKKKENTKRVVKKGTKIAAIIIPIVIILAIAITFGMNVLKYSNAEKAFERGDYETAITLYEELDDYKDSASKCANIKIYNNAIQALNKQDYESAISEFEKIPNFADVPQKLEESNAEMTEYYYSKAVETMDSSHSTAKNLFQKVPKDYKDTAEYLTLIEKYDVLCGTYKGTSLATSRTPDFYFVGANNDIVLDVYGKSESNISATFVTVESMGGYIINWENDSFSVTKNNDGTFTLSGTYEYAYKKYPFDWTYQNGNMSAEFKFKEEPAVYFYKIQ